MRQKLFRFSYVLLSETVNYLAVAGVFKMFGMQWKPLSDFLSTLALRNIRVKEKHFSLGKKIFFN